MVSRRDLQKGIELILHNNWNTLVKSYPETALTFTAPEPEGIPYYFMNEIPEQKYITDKGYVHFDFRKVATREQISGISDYDLNEYALIISLHLKRDTNRKAQNTLLEILTSLFVKKTFAYTSSMPNVDFFNLQEVMQPQEVDGWFVSRFVLTIFNLEQQPITEIVS